MLDYIALLFVIFIIIGLFMLVRNEWVYAQFQKINFDTREEYLNYDEMMIRFWIWDVERLRK